MFTRACVLLIFLVTFCESTFDSATEWKSGKGKITIGSICNHKDAECCQSGKKIDSAKIMGSKEQETMRDCMDMCTQGNCQWLHYDWNEKFCEVFEGSAAPLLVNATGYTFLKFGPLCKAQDNRDVGENKIGSTFEKWDGPKNVADAKANAAEDTEAKITVDTEGAKFDDGENVQIEDTKDDALGFSKIDDFYAKYIGMIFKQIVSTNDGQDPADLSIPYTGLNIIDFDLLEADCMTFENKLKTTGEMKLIESTESEKTEVLKKSSDRATTSVTASLGAASAAYSRTKTSSTENTDSTATQMSEKKVITENKMEHRRYSLKDKCLRWLPLNWDFIFVFEQLPINIITSQHHKAYYDFLNMWGAHVITSITTGTKYRSVQYQKSTSRSSSNEVKSAACESQKLEMGISGPAWLGFKLAISLSQANGACDSSSRGENTINTDSTTEDTYKIYGGDNKMRGNMMFARSKKNIATLLSLDNPVWHVPVTREIRTLWEMLTRIFPRNSANYIRAKNLEISYGLKAMGTLDTFGCYFTGLELVLTGTAGLGAGGKLNKRQSKVVQTNSGEISECQSECQKESWCTWFQFIPDPNSCRESFKEEKGQDYRGCQDKTQEGLECQNWSKQKPHSHKMTPEWKSEEGIGDHNFCRNPDNSQRIWCYINNPPPKIKKFGNKILDQMVKNMPKVELTRWDYCNPIPAGSCGLYELNSYFELKPALNGYVNGPKICDNSKDEPKCITDGRKIIGKDVWNYKGFKEGDTIISIGSATKCQKKCQDINNCKYWNYTPSTTQCHFLSSMEKFENDKNVKCGPKYCLYYIIQDNEENTMEKQFQSVAGQDLFWEFAQQDSSYSLVYTSSQCTDYWQTLGQVVSVDECSTKCNEEERCFYFGYGRGNHFKECFSAGFECNTRSKNTAIEFDIYKLFANPSAPFSLIKNMNNCQNVGAIPFYDSSCDAPAGQIDPSCIAESIFACSAFCELQYSSKFFLWERTSETVEAQNKCQCYVGDTCTLHSCISPTEKFSASSVRCPDTMKWNIYMILEKYENVVDNLRCPATNIFVSSTRPTISRHVTDTMESCAKACNEVAACLFGVFEVRTGLCYLQAGPIASIASKTGYMSCKRKCCKKIEQNIGELFWDSHLTNFYV